MGHGSPIGSIFLIFSGSNSKYIYKKILFVNFATGSNSSAIGHDVIFPPVVILNVSIPQPHLKKHLSCFVIILHNIPRKGAIPNTLPFSQFSKNKFISFVISKYYFI